MAGSAEFIPYSCQSISADDIEAVQAVLTSSHLTQGPTIEEFEQAFSSRHQVKYSVAVSNATAGLHIGCIALGVGPGGLVWTSPNSFLASANCALYCGATVDFVDIDPLTRNMSLAALSDKLKLAERLGRLPQVVIPVDFSGLPCDLAEMRALADLYGFKILEDASHATGASYLNNPVGSQFAHACVFSFHAVKIVTTAEGGMITTQDREIAMRLRLLRSHGMTRDPVQMERTSDGPWYYEQKILGYNYRLTDIQAALGISQLRRLEKTHSAREELAARYNKLLVNLPLLLPASFPDRRSSWHLYAIEIDPAQTDVARDAVFAALRAYGVGVNLHYIPIHTQPYFEKLGFSRGQYPNAERYASRAISIPLFPGLTEAQQHRVVDVLSGVLK